jgi:hypothetical protein
MITTSPHNYFAPADGSGDCSLGNVLYSIAGTIGIAIKNGYSYGFPSWPNQKYFINTLPGTHNKKFKPFQNPVSYKNYDIGFQGFNVPDGVNIDGYLGSYKYFEHCEDIIRYYFSMKALCAPFENCILVHYRAYNNPSFAKLDHKYYSDAISRMPQLRVVVITDNIKEAKKVIGNGYEYISTNPIVDFYLLSHTKHLVMANSTFSWWAAWLSGAMTVAPSKWFAGDFSDCPVNMNDAYPDKWIII